MIPRMCALDRTYVVYVVQEVEASGIINICPRSWSLKSPLGA